MQLCSTLLAALRDREHSPIVKDCLDRCQRCALGFVIASADGMPLGVTTFEQLLAEVDTLAADEFA